MAELSHGFIDYLVPGMLSQRLPNEGENIVTAYVVMRAQ